MLDWWENGYLHYSAPPCFYRGKTTILLQQFLGHSLILFITNVVSQLYGSISGEFG